MANKKKGALEALLGADINVEEEVFIKRIGEYFTVKAIDGNTLEKLKEQATHYIGKGKDRRPQLDNNELGRLLISEACIDPDFSDERLLKKYGASDAGDCVQKALLAGEINKLGDKVLEISGFIDDEDEVKNG